MRSKYPSKSFSFQYPRSPPYFALVHFHLSSLHGVLSLFYDSLGRLALAESTASCSSSLAASREEPFWLRCHMKIRETWTTPTHPRKKLTAARLEDWGVSRRSRKGSLGSGTYRTLRGLIIRHQRVQIAPVAIKAQFWVRESFSAGRLKSEIPAMTRAHCLQGEISHVPFLVSQHAKLHIVHMIP